MGFIRDITGKTAAQSAEQAAQTQAGYQQQALDYLKQQEALPQEIREQALTGLSGLFGLGDDGALTIPGADVPTMTQEQMIQQAQDSPLFAALMQGQEAGEEAILRQAGATGGLRSGNVQQALAQQAQNLRTQALLQSYGEQRQLEERDYLRGQGQIQRQLSGLQGLAGLQSYAPQIAGGMAGIGQTLGQGQIAGAQALQQGMGNLLDLGGKSIALLACDKRFKTNIEHIGQRGGVDFFTWDWNELAEQIHGLIGAGFGPIAQTLELTHPELVYLNEDGYLLVDAERLAEAMQLQEAA